MLPSKSTDMKLIRLNIYNALLLGALLLSFSSCRKFVDTETPPYSLDRELAFSDSLTATSAVLGIYASIASGSQTGGNNAVVYLSAAYGAMSADEAYSRNNADFDPFRYNTLTPGNTLITYWQALYGRINRANYAIEGLTASTTLSATLKNQLMGEARFWRGWLYFQLMNYFGDAPLVLSSAALENARLPRSPKAEVLQQVMTDLTEAKKLLTLQYPSVDRARINRNVVSAFLARVYFFQQQWRDAEVEANAVISSGTYSLVQNLDNVFLNNSNETIWQISLFNTTVPATVFGAQFLPANNVLTFALYDELANTFEVNDQRKLKWAKSLTLVEGGVNKTYYYPFKYKQRSTTAGNEYPIMLRLSEMYLIRGEALAQQDNLPDARRDLDSVRRRAGLLPTTASSKTDVLIAFEHERWVELFTESGDRWFNLRRLNKAAAVLKPIKPNWQDFQQLYPIPQSAINSNPALIDNTGYIR